MKSKSTGLVLAITLAALMMAVAVPCARADGPNRAGVIVVFDNGNIIKSCVEFSEAELSGVELLRRAGFQLVTDASFGLGEAVCKIEGLGCDFPGEHCFCECMGAPCVYWGYWNRQGDGWSYSGRGGSNRRVRNGDVDAWVWGNEDNTPPDLDLAALCDDPTATPTLTPMLATSTPTATRTATVTGAAPTSTLTRTPTPTSSTPTPTPTSSATPQQPSATHTPWGSYPEGTHTAVVIVSTHTPGAYPQSTSTLRPTWTPKPTWTLLATLTATASPGASPTRMPGAVTTASPTASAIAPQALPTPPTPMAAAVALTEPAPYPELTAAPLAIKAQDVAVEQPVIAVRSEQPAPVSTDDGSASRLLARAVADSQATPTSAPSAERRARRSYGAFAGLAAGLLLLIGYAAQVNRQRRQRELPHD